jgi:hypothetical protein
MQFFIVVLAVVCGLCAAFSPVGMASGRASATSLKMGGYAMGINGFGRIGRLVARIMVSAITCL